MRDKYFFDKREWKRRWAKYGIIFLISFFPIVLFNYFCSGYLGSQGLVIFLDCVLLLLFVAIGNGIASKIFEKRDAKLDRLRREREEIEERKRQIMEDSYKKKREEKQKAKEEKGAEPVVELTETDIETENNQQGKNKAKTVKNPKASTSKKVASKTTIKTNLKTSNSKNINKVDK